MGVNATEYGAIQRLAELVGSDLRTAAEAYFAFERNEEQAANFLIDIRDGNLVHIARYKDGPTQKHLIGNSILLASTVFVITLICGKLLRSPREFARDAQTPLL